MLERGSHQKLTVAAKAPPTGQKAKRPPNGGRGLIERARARLGATTNGSNSRRLTRRVSASE